MAILDGGRGSTKILKEVKKDQTKRKTSKDELKKVESEFTKRKTVREYIQQQQPTAPSLYLGL